MIHVSRFSGPGERETDAPARSHWSGHGRSVAGGRVGGGGGVPARESRGARWCARGWWSYGNVMVFGERVESWGGNASGCRTEPLRLADGEAKAECRGKRPPGDGGMRHNATGRIRRFATRDVCSGLQTGRAQARPFDPQNSILYLCHQLLLNLTDGAWAVLRYFAKAKAHCRRRGASKSASPRRTVGTSSKSDGRSVGRFAVFRQGEGALQATRSVEIGIPTEDRGGRVRLRATPGLSGRRTIGTSSAACHARAIGTEDRRDEFGCMPRQGYRDGGPSGRVRLRPTPGLSLSARSKPVFRRSG